MSVQLKVMQLERMMAFLSGLLVWEPALWDLLSETVMALWSQHKQHHYWTKYKFYQLPRSLCNKEWCM